MSYPSFLEYMPLPKCKPRCKPNFLNNWWGKRIIQPKAANDNKSPFDNGYRFTAALEKKGYTILGQGNFSRVLAKKGSDKVIKVICSQDNWIDYVTWAAEKGYAGTFAPKVYSYKHIKRGNFSVAVVERMEKTLSQVKSSEDMDLVSNLVSYYGSMGNTMAGLFLDELAPGLAAFTKDLHTKFRHHLDLHNGNYMLRKDGTFCVTDPVYGASSNTHKRLKAGDFTSLAKAA